MKCKGFNTSYDYSSEPWFRMLCNARINVRRLSRTNACSHSENGRSVASCVSGKAYHGDIGHGDPGHD